MTNLVSEVCCTALTSHHYFLFSFSKPVYRDIWDAGLWFSLVTTSLNRTAHEGTKFLLDDGFTFNLYRKTFWDLILLAWLIVCNSFVLYQIFLLLSSPWHSTFNLVARLVYEKTRFPYKFCYKTSPGILAGVMQHLYRRYSCIPKLLLESSFLFLRQSLKNER